VDEQIDTVDKTERQRERNNRVTAVMLDLIDGNRERVGGL
jgi:hypothetical protein